MAFKLLLGLALLLGSNAMPFDDQEVEDVDNFFVGFGPSGRILGGAPAPHSPHMVALTTGTLVRSLVCGGSVVTTRTVLTAAHCVPAGNQPHGHFRGTVGTNLWNSGGVSYLFQRSIRHPNFNLTTVKNDIAVLITANPIVFTATVQPVTLEFNFVGGGVPTILRGWGRTRLNGPFSPNLLELRATVVDGARCVEDVARRVRELNLRHVPVVEPAIEICSFHSPGIGVCQGDSGSPLLRGDTNRQIGITAWGLLCARGAPDVFARISAFQGWLAANVV